MTSLLQKTLLITKRVVIESDRLRVQTKDLREELEYSIQFEKSGFYLVKKRVKSANIPFYCFLVFDLLYVWLLITSVASKEPFKQQLFWLGALLFFSVMTVLAFYSRNKDVIYLTGGQRTFELFATRPDSRTVLAFIGFIHQAMRHYYKDKAACFDQNLPYELRLARLEWLSEKQVISLNEYRNLLHAMRRETILGFPSPSNN
jgi:hypothetical protein